MVTDAGCCLLVDMGNQRLKWRLLDGVADIDEGRSRKSVVEGIVSLPPDITGDRVSMDAESTWLRDLENSFCHLPAPQRILLSAVCQNETVDQFIHWCRRHWQVGPEWLVAQKEFDGLTNGYENPAQLGCDRWLAAIAAHRLVCGERAHEAVVVVDAGTAVTVDLVAHHQFIGGAIFPGIMTMIRILGRDTGQIRLPSSAGCLAGSTQTANSPPSPLARNSEDAVIAGAYHAVCGGVEHCIRTIRSRLGSGGSHSVLMTGGDARTLSAGVCSAGECRPNLVLDGLALVAGQRLS